jgi:hypothetical protein
MSRYDIYGEIEAERERQDEKWGGPEHDDGHTSHDWVAYLARHAGKAVMWPFGPSLFRRQMIRVAALAVAAVEWEHRRTVRTAAEAGVNVARKETAFLERLRPKPAAERGPR